MDDDFNTGGATADLFEIARAINRFIDQNQLETSPSQSAKRELHDALSILRELAALLGIFRKPLPASQSIQDSGKVVEGLMQLVLKLRMEARARRDFATSDAVRDGLKEIGILLQDGKQGTTWEIQK
jgi:cysteinyl-tRNA synthetase